MPHIEDTYRVIPDRRQRIIAGFSMGGYGAIRYALKFPDLFSMCISMDGAIHNLKSIKAIRGPIFTEIFEEDGDYFESQCVFELARQNAQRVNGKVFFIILVGLLRSFNQRFRRHMAVSGLPIQDRYYIETGCEHDAACILERQRQRLVAQIGAHLSGKAISSP
jgi:pimeloyl-ACP methyl ester carboxylesterase